jgi:hypothetical protein
MKNLFAIFREGEAGGAGGGAAAAAASAGGAPGGLAAAAAAAAGAQGGGDQGQSNGQATAGGQQSAGQQNGAYYPDGLPDQFRGQTERETIDKLFAEVNGRPKPPATAKDYKFELSPEMKEKFGELKDDKVLPLWAEVAHELGLDDKGATAAFEKLYQKMDKAGLVDHGPNYDAEIKKLMPNAGNDRERMQSVQSRINGAQAFIQGLETNGTLTKEQAANLHALTDTANGVMTMEALQKAMGGTGIVNGGAPANGRRSKDAIKTDMADPRYDPLSPKYDKAFQERIDTEYRGLYGAA